MAKVIAARRPPRKNKLSAEPYSGSFSLTPAPATLGLVGSVPIILIGWHVIDPVKPAPASTQLRVAVRAAIKAYKKTGHMLDAALAYASHGYPVFPITKDKKPVPRRDRDANGKDIPGTGGFKKATCDPAQIHKWWDRQQHLIGMPMGERTGVWCFDVDTGEDHADGVAEWKKIAAQHEPIVTREHRSATGGPHLIFNFHADRLNGCSNGSLPGGLDVKGHGSYIVVPPSERKGRAYTVHSDINPVDHPQWLTELILQGRSRHSDGGEYTGQITADYDEIAEALSFIPNVDVGWVEWKNMAMRLYAALGDAGLVLFEAWSALSVEYNHKITPIECWEEVQGCPPTHTGAEMIFKIAREHGWVRKAEPTYSPDIFADAETARRTAEQIMQRFLSGAIRVDPFLALGFEVKDLEPPPPVIAMRIVTGVGKTRIVIRKSPSCCGALLLKSSTLWIGTS
jgi:Bifunctional DNA primase/polymerase, N-terminal/Primase C terminal 2 (PriCT-2)